MNSCERFMGKVQTIFHFYPWMKWPRPWKLPYSEQTGPRPLGVALSAVCTSDHLQTLNFGGESKSLSSYPAAVQHKWTQCCTSDSRRAAAAACVHCLSGLFGYKREEYIRHLRHVSTFIITEVYTVCSGAKYCEYSQIQTSLTVTTNGDKKWEENATDFLTEHNADCFYLFICFYL